MNENSASKLRKIFQDAQNYNVLSSRSLKELDEEFDEIITKMKPKGWGSITMDFAFAWVGAVKGGEEYREFHEWLIEQGKAINLTVDLEVKKAVVDQTWNRINAAQTQVTEP